MIKPCMLASSVYIIIGSVATRASTIREKIDREYSVHYFINWAWSAAHAFTPSKILHAKFNATG